MKWIFVYYVVMIRELNVSDNDSKGEGAVHDAFEMDSSINDFRDTLIPLLTNISFSVFRKLFAKRNIFISQRIIVFKKNK